MRTHSYTTILRHLRTTHQMTLIVIMSVILRRGAPVKAKHDDAQGGRAEG